MKEDYSSEKVERVRLNLIDAAELIKSDRHYDFVLKSLPLIKDFVRSHGKNFSPSECEALRNVIESIVTTINAFDETRKQRQGVDQMVNDLQYSINRLLSQERER